MYIYTYTYITNASRLMRAPVTSTPKLEFNEGVGNPLSVHCRKPLCRDHRNLFVRRLSQLLKIYIKSTPACGC